jgi:ribosomal protein S18 acetylase RimI-like enzyme
MIKALDFSFADYIAEHQDMYPEAMREEVSTFKRLLSGGFCWGYFIDEELFGWILFEPETKFERRLYCYDLAVLPACQGNGYGFILWKHAIRELRWLNYEIHAHCRKTSYSLIVEHSEGYCLTMDHFIENHYAREYGDDSLIGEHAHEIVLKPRMR